MLCFPFSTKPAVPKDPFSVSLGFAVAYEEVSTVHITRLIPEVFGYYFIDKRC